MLTKRKKKMRKQRGASPETYLKDKYMQHLSDFLA